MLIIPDIITTDEDPGLRIESFAIKKYMMYLIKKIILD